MTPDITPHIVESGIVETTPLYNRKLGSEHLPVVVAIP
jgi:hypothetical protein